MTPVFIAVGSNLGDRERFIAEARIAVASLKGVRFLAASKNYETSPVGGPAGQGNYLNAVWQSETSLAPEELLTQLLAIEKKMGRIREEANAPRTIDLDILFYGQEIIHNVGNGHDRSLLTIPHPRLHERRFVLEPLAELAADFVHPLLKKTVKELLHSIEHSNHGTRSR